MRVIVFAIDGCPAGWLGAYGNDWVGTPNLDQLAAEGIAFDRHISDRPEPNAARRAWGGPHTGATDALVTGTRSGQSSRYGWPRVVLRRLAGSVRCPPAARGCLAARPASPDSPRASGPSRRNPQLLTLDRNRSADSAVGRSAGRVRGLSGRYRGREEEARGGRGRGCRRGS